MATIGYARVSSAGQKLTAQVAKLKKHGCKKIYQEKISGTDQCRSQLKACLDYLREGDTLVITKLDRLARSASHLGRIIDTFQDQDIHLVVLDQAIDTTKPTGKLMFHMLSAFAEFENNLRKERQMDGIRQAQASGVILGRPRAITNKMSTNIKKDRKASMKIAQIMAKYDVSKSSVYRILHKFRPQCNLSTKPIKSPLRYPGGKSRAVKSILKLIPKKIEVLCSPFLGSGSIELACVQQGIKVYGYDAFAPLVNFWQTLLENAPKLTQAVRKYYPLTRNEFYALQKTYHKLKDPIEKAAIFFTLNRTSFSGTTLSGGMSPNHPRFKENIIDALETFNLSGLYVEKADFQESIRKHKNDFLYLDPPYFNEQKLYGNQGDLSRDFDHEGLASLIKKRPGWILSYNDCPKVRNLYQGHDFLSLEWAYGMNKNKKSNEVLILSCDDMKN